jgi:hypothetical protein
MSTMWMWITVRTLRDIQTKVQLLQKLKVASVPYYLRRQQKGMLGGDGARRIRYISFVIPKVELPSGT